MEKLEITEIKRIVSLIQKIECKNYAVLTDTAKELGVKKTELMQFIEDNNKLFKISEVNGVKGLTISNVYLKPEDNPETDEWIEKKKKEWEKKLHVSKMYYYGCFEFYYITTDTDGYCSHKEYLYRNTDAKMNKLIEDGILTYEKRGYGGFGDYTIGNFILFNSNIDKITNAGWTTDFEEIKEE